MLLSFVFFHVAFAFGRFSKKKIELIYFRAASVERQWTEAVADPGLNLALH